jgi:exodeoxyribonuclease VIII
MIASAKIIGEGVSYEDYAKQPNGEKRGGKLFVMSRGELTNFALNPKRWLDGYRDDEADTDATRWGSLIECLAGLSGKFEDFYAVAPAEYIDGKTGALKPWNWNANACKDWRESQGECEVIKSDLRAKALAALDALAKDHDVSALFECSQKQVMVVGVWKDKGTGLEIPIRCLIDLVPDYMEPVFYRALADFKTCRNGCPDLWARVVDDAGYDVQAALSLDLYAKATGEDRIEWLMPCQENVHPYHVVLPMPALSTEFLAFGRAKYKIALREYARCLATGVWPSYSTGNRLVIGPTQIIGPESVWRYRESGGTVASRQDYEAAPKPERESEGGITP